MTGAGQFCRLSLLQLVLLFVNNCGIICRLWPITHVILGAQGVLNWVLSQRFLPPIAIIVPLVLIFHNMGLRDTHLGLIIAHTLINIPIAVLLLKSFIDDIPNDIDQAAMIDGASRWRIFWKIIMPMSKGGLATRRPMFYFSWTGFTRLILNQFHSDNPP